MEKPTEQRADERGADSVQRMVRRICKICGESDEEHHEPDCLEIPQGCVCDWRTWDYDNKTTLPPACNDYKGDGQQNCETCEHDKACHTPNDKLSESAREKEKR